MHAGNSRITRPGGQQRPKAHEAQQQKNRHKPEKAVLYAPAATYQHYLGVSQAKKFWNHFSIYACHLCARAMLIFSVSFQF